MSESDRGGIRLCKQYVYRKALLGTLEVGKAVLAPAVVAQTDLHRVRLAHGEQERGWGDVSRSRKTDTAEGGKDKAVVGKQWQYNVSRNNFLRLPVNRDTCHHQARCPEWWENPVKEYQDSLCKTSVVSSAKYFYSGKKQSVLLAENYWLHVLHTKTANRSWVSRIKPYEILSLSLKQLY